MSFILQVPDIRKTTAEKRAQVFDHAIQQIFYPPLTLQVAAPDIRVGPYALGPGAATLFVQAS